MKKSEVPSRKNRSTKSFYRWAVRENMNADTENGELAKQILDEYYQGFQERNPQLRVFSAHLHMDEATPHLHIDFVPFTTGSKRGLDTRVSLKQALATQGFNLALRRQSWRYGVVAMDTVRKRTACGGDGTLWD